MVNPTLLALWQMLPGTILYLPPAGTIGMDSVIYHQVDEGFRFFGHPVLILHADSATEIVDVVPVVTLRGSALDAARAAAGNHIWHEYILIHQAWNNDDFAAMESDPDVKAFQKVYLGRHSFRTREKHWVMPEVMFKIEATYLHGYPFEPANQRPQSLPNPRYYLSSQSLARMQSVAGYYHSHLPYTEPVSRLPLQEPPLVGHVYRLSEAGETKNVYLLQAQTYSPAEKPLGRPILVTHVDVLLGGVANDGPKTAVRGFLITDFSFGSIDRTIPRGGVNSERIRTQYLPIEGPHSELHDRLPAVTLARDSPRFRKAQYIHVLKLLRVEVNELKGLTAVGAPEVHFEEETVHALLEWHQALRMGPGTSFYHERRHVLEQQGLAGLLNVQVQGEAAQITLAHADIANSGPNIGRN
ncbi:uncharacterized protein EI97DRAFT_443387 [Westerdykella ornata]|uniref:Uncharacterized protein n=1 Tax=Westerdykella ornata TaxID=318751 RepID=A0A6A6JFM9_WESOR|nr:uncharacterized protein EI97DRAFT_443387 [Westerdykella ornata]KAF2275137.1 hypothetical protein EI97DRAFT_443387 [Westerdykella ornata]